MEGYTTIPDKLFDNDDLSYVTQSLGMWLCYLCQHDLSGTHVTKLDALEGLVGHHLTAGDMYRLSRAGIIHYEQKGDYWMVSLTD